jgi:putative ABC transport system permease protein
VLGRAIRIALAGVSVGLLLAFVASRWLEPLLFRQSARDPRVYGVVGLTMLAVALMAGVLPARRAAGADPNSVLRAD